MFKKALISLALILVIFGSLFGFKALQIQKVVSQIKPPPPPTVAVTEVKTAQWSSNLTAVGSLHAVASVDVSNEVAGLVKSIHFDSGQSVKAGQLLLQLDDSSDQAELRGLIAENKLAQARFNRAEALIGKHFVSQADYDQNQAGLEQTEAAISAKRTQIAKKRITAPFSGDLGIRQIDLGQYLKEGSAIVGLQQLSPIYLDFNVPERDLNRVQPGQTVEITVEAFPQQRFKGVIRAISPAIETDNRSVKVRAELSNGDKKLRPGMFAEVLIESGQVSTVLTLPDTAIDFSPYGNSVYRVEHKDGKTLVQNRQIRVGETRQGRVAIEQGLEPGDQVVAAGQLKLRNGMEILIDQQPAPSER